MAHVQSKEANCLELNGITVMVTGATGYVAGWIVKRLLEAGANVHAPIRNLENTDKVAHLNAVAKKTSGSIAYFKADLLDIGSYAEAMEGCEIIFHTASPFITNITDAQTELIDPALIGTRNVLDQACKTTSVQKIILTSSIAAIFGSNADMLDTENNIFTEKHWNERSSLTDNPYPYSKTLAEKEAWRIADTQSQWKLVVINPALVFGPAVNPDTYSESFSMLTQFADGTLRFGGLDIGVGVVDVRDVADIHVEAAVNMNASGRYIACGHNSNLMEITNSLLPKYGKNFPLPRWKLPKSLLWLFGPMLNKMLTRQYISNNVSHPWRGDNSKSIIELGAKYRPLEETINEMFQQLIDAGRFKK